MKKLSDVLNGYQARSKTEAYDEVQIFAKEHDMDILEGSSSKHGKNFHALPKQRPIYTTGASIIVFY